MKKNYWLNLFSYETWQEFLDAGGKTTGFRDGRWGIVSKIKPGDILLCYMVGISRFVGVLEVIRKPYRSETPVIWKNEIFSCRVDVELLSKLSPETAVPVLELKKELSFFSNLSSPNAWSGRFRGSPAKWSASDGEVVVKAVFDNEKNPVNRSFDLKKLARRPKASKSKAGAFTIPDIDETSAKSTNQHTKIQWLLLKMGNDMGLNVWVANNDKSRSFDGNNFADIKNIINELPLHFDEATTKTIKHIDVLWLKENAIVAAFEIESTTSIYSGLLRMADLITMQPNINIPLYIVAPESRRDKVISEINRPTFSKLPIPMVDVCRFIPFGVLFDFEGKSDPTMVKFLKSDYIETLSETCEIEDV